MRLQKSELKLAVREAVGKYLDLETYEVFIFGSEAAGTATAQSDIDIGIRGPKPVSKPVLQRIRDELEAVRTLRIFDVVDLTVTDPSFQKKALQTAERI